MAVTVSLVYTNLAKSEPGLGRMIHHLSTTLQQEEGVKVQEVNIDASRIDDLSQIDSQMVVFCGYDHMTLAALHVSLAKAPGQVSLVMYDEPGASIERELNTLTFRGVDSDRFPSGSLSRLLHCWTYRDILGLVRRLLLEYPDGPRSAQTTGKPSQAKSPGRSRSGANRARQMENPGEQQAPDRAGDAEASSTPDSEQQAGGPG